MSSYLDSLAKYFCLVNQPLSQEYSLLSSKKKNDEMKTTALFASEIQEDGKCKYCKTIWIPGINVRVKIRYGESRKRIRKLSKVQIEKRSEKKIVAKDDKAPKRKSLRVKKDMTRYLVYQCMNCGKHTTVYGLIQENRNRLSTRERITKQIVGNNGSLDNDLSKTKTNIVKGSLDNELSKIKIESAKIFDPKKSSKKLTRQNDSEGGSTLFDKQPLMSNKVSKLVNNKSKNKSKKKLLLLKKPDTRKESLSLFDFMNDQ